MKDDPLKEWRKSAAVTLVKGGAEDLPEAVEAYESGEGKIRRSLCSSSDMRW